MATEITEPAVRLGEWFTILATLAGALFGPIAAIQVQKWLERRQADNERRERLFFVLMATRSSRLSADHVQALNMIDLTFYPKTSGPAKKRAELDRSVIEAWKVYIDHLNNTPNNLEGDAVARVFERRDDLFYDLLERMANTLGYHFDRVVLKNHGYTPQAFGNIENENELIRHKLIALLAGDAPIKMEITNIPRQPE